ncbi:MAG: DNA-binding protein [Caulobacter sp.]|nr:DNA-binding protein [Caulobacter sp.]
MWAFTAYSYAATTVTAAWFVRRAARAHGLAVDLPRSLLWQGLVYSAWLPAAGLTWLIFRRFGAGGRALAALAAASLVVPPLESLVSAWIDMGFHGAHGLEPLLGRALARWPVSILLYTAIAAVGLAAAHHHRFAEARARTEALEAALADARAALARLAETPAKAPERLMVITGSRRAPVALNEVEWFAAADNYVVVHWAGREGLMRATLQSLEARLDPRVFARCHRSAIVNLARVRETQSLSDGSWRLTLDSGADLVTSRTYRDDLLRRLGRDPTRPYAASTSSE